MSMADIARELLRLEVFQGLRPLQVTEIARGAERVVYKSGQKLIEIDEAGDAAVFVVSGEAVRTAGPEMGDRPEPVEPGSLLGEMAMLIETEHTSTVVAQGPVRALRITRRHLQHMMEEDPGLAEHFVAKIVRRLSSIADELRRIDEGFGQGAGPAAAALAAAGAAAAGLPAASASLH